jgi:Complex I intermediate-associated protein 30 (CIA30)
VQAGVFYNNKKISPCWLVRLHAFCFVLPELQIQIIEKFTMINVLLLLTLAILVVAATDQVDIYARNDANGVSKNDNFLPSGRRLRPSTNRYPKTPQTHNSTDYKILLESFADPKHEWVEMNDPVMGGKSTGSFRIDAEKGIGIFAGTVNDVPFLHAPGFIQVRTIMPSSSQYPDISHCQAFELIVSSQYPQYNGYRMSFGTQHAPHGKMFAYGYKTHFTFESKNNGNDSSQSMDMTFQSILLPFHKFTDYWDDATGDAIIECNPDDSNDRMYCPTPQALHDIQTIGLWGEGYVGDVNINIQAIYAIHCNDRRNSNDNNGVVDGNHAHIDSWWSHLNQLLFRNSKADAVSTVSSSSSSSGSSKTATSTAATALLQRNMLLSSLFRHRW